METVDNFYCDGRLETRKEAAAYKAWWSGKMQTQDVEKIRKKTNFLQKKLDISRPLYDNIYRIILCGQAAAYARVSRRTYAGAHP